MGERQPKPLGEVLGALVSGRGWSERMTLGRLRENWASIVGATVAERSEPSSLARGVLTVRAEGGAWASELTLMAPHIATRTNGFLGSDAVREIKISPSL